MYLKLIIIFSFFICASNNPLNVQPILSEEGKRTFRLNLSIVDNNIERIKDHRNKVSLNVKMIENELIELSRLEASSLELINKFRHQLNSAINRISKNEKVIAELDRKIAQQTRNVANKNEVLSSKIEEFEIEKKERLLWQADATSKLIKLKNIIRELEENYTDLGRYRGPILEQLRIWQNREKTLIKMLKQFEEMRQAIINGEYSPITNNSMD